MVHHPDPGLTQPNADEPTPTTQVAGARANAARAHEVNGSPTRLATLTHAGQVRANAAVAWLAEPPATLRLGPFRPNAFTSRLRSPRLTSQLGIALGVCFGICFLTGLTSHFIQHPGSWFWWPAGPAQLYRVTQGLHVATGLATIPLLGVKLWAVYPQLFAWPPVPVRPGAAAERIGVAALVAAGLFQLVSGTLNVARWYGPMPFFFTSGHYWVAWLAIGAIVAHIGVKLPIIRTALARPGRSMQTEPTSILSEPAENEAGVGAPKPQRPNADQPSEPSNDQPTSTEPGQTELGAKTDKTPSSRQRTPGIKPPQTDPSDANELPRGGNTDRDGNTGADGADSGDGADNGGADGRDGADNGGGGLDRRKLLLVVGAAAGLITVATVGQTLAPLAPISLLAPRRPTTGPQHVPVNKTAGAAGVRDAALDPAYALQVIGTATRRTLSLAELQALTQYTVVLPISCVEGWSSTGTWSGVRLRDLADLVGADPTRHEAQVESLERGGSYRISTVATPHLSDPRTLIALRLNGEPLAMDHGFPARLIAPNRPGVLQTKWVATITLQKPA